MFTFFFAKLLGLAPWRSQESSPLLEFGEGVFAGFVEGVEVVVGGRGL